MENNESIINFLRLWNKRALKATADAHKILSVHEASKSRVILLENLLDDLSSLPVDIQDYFQEAVTCLEFDLKRAAIVLSWSGFFSVISESFYRSHESVIRSCRPKWNFKDLTELKERYPEYQILETFKVVKLIKNSELQIYLGQLATRNKCAHPTLYSPSLNSAIGYLDEMIQQTKKYL